MPLAVGPRALLLQFKMIVDTRLFPHRAQQVLPALRGDMPANLDHPLPEFADGGEVHLSDSPGKEALLSGRVDQENADEEKNPPADEPERLEVAHSAYKFTVSRRSTPGPGAIAGEGPDRDQAEGGYMGSNLSQASQMSFSLEPSATMSKTEVSFPRGISSKDILRRTSLEGHRGVRSFLQSLAINLYRLII